MKNLSILLAFLCSIVLVACGGGGGGGSTTGSTADYSGVFQGTLSRAETSNYFVAVKADRALEIVLTDTSLGTLTGTGTVGTDGNFSTPITNGIDTVTVAGTIVLNGTAKTVTGTLAGDIVGNWTATLIGPIGTNVFAGAFTGVYDGDDFGNLTASIFANGTLTGTVEDSGANMGTLTGTVSPAGLVSFTSTVTSNGSTTTITYTGTATIEDGVITLIGDWTQDGLGGAWSLDPTG